MTKQELLNSLTASSIVSALVTDARLEQENELGDRFYHVNVRKVQGNCINYENVRFVVIDEGKVTEQAFFYQTDILDFPNFQEQGIMVEGSKAVVENTNVTPTPVVVVKS